MRVVDRLARRQESWRELQFLLLRMEDRRVRRSTGKDMPELPEPLTLAGRKGIRAVDVLRLGELYRSACADLMLAEAHDLPRETVGYLHSMVGRAHNTVYRTQGFRLVDWGGVVFGAVPRKLRSDPFLRVAALTFWGLFLLMAFVSAAQPDFANRVLGEHQVEAMDSTFEHAFDGAKPLERNDSMMAGFYIYHNAGIGLSCYAWGLLCGVGSLWVLASNAISLGTAFGHMATVPAAANFFTFVTAHGPFELTAIVFSGAAGLRLGSGLIITRGQTRLASLHREAVSSLPIVGVSVILFILAAFIEGFISATMWPYWIKASIAILSTLLLGFYLFALGRDRRVPVVAS